MSKDKKAQEVARRDFFKHVGLGAVAVGTVAAGGAASASEAGEQKISTGYRETAHVKTYYELAKF